MLHVKGVAPVSVAGLGDELARRIKEHRLRRNLSQEEAARELGVALRTFQNWESGRKWPHPKHRRALDAFLRDAA